MNDNDVIKEFTKTFEQYKTKGDFRTTVYKEVIALINRLQAEIKRKDKILNSYALQYGTVKDQNKKIEEIKSEARKEFAEMLKGKMYIKKDKLYYSEIIDNLLAEMDGKDKENAFRRSNQDA